MIMLNVINTCYNHTKSSKSGRPDEEKEIFVIPLTNTCSKPWTMMIKSLNTTITDFTMMSSRRPVDSTSMTVLDNCQSALHNHHELLLLPIFAMRLIQSFWICLIQKLPHWNCCRICAYGHQKRNWRYYL